MGTGTVERITDIMAGPVGEELGETSAADDSAGGVVGLPPSNGLVGGKGSRDDSASRVPRVAHRVEDVLLALGRLAANDAGPGDVVITRCMLVEARPNIDQDEVSRANWR